MESHKLGAHPAPRAEVLLPLRPAADSGLSMALCSLSLANAREWLGEVKHANLI